MIQKPLYTGNGVSLSPVWEEGRTESAYVRLIAEEGMAITDGVTVAACVDVPEENTALWRDCEETAPDETEATEADYRAALSEFGVNV